MFKFRRKPQPVPTHFYDHCRKSPGKLCISQKFIVVYLGDVDVMTTVYHDNLNMSNEEALELVKRGLAKSRHHQLYV